MKNSLHPEKSNQGLFRIKKIDPFGSLIEACQPDQEIRELDPQVFKEIYQRDQLLLFRGFKTLEQPESFLEFCESWGQVHIWPFGKILDIVEHPNPKDHIFDNSFVPLHWDGMFAPTVPEYQIFQCVNTSSEQDGGQTVFSNTLLALNLASKEQKESWAQVKGTYLREIAILRRKAVSPLIEKHPHRDFSVIRYSEDTSLKKERLVNPVKTRFSGLENAELKKIQEEISQVLYDSRCLLVHFWKKGDILIADNLTLLHGRNPFKSQSQRHLRRVSVLGDLPVKNKNLVY